MRQILCVIDFTDSSGKVLEVATRIANACRAHLIVLFPYRLIDHTFQGKLPSLKLKLESAAREKFEKLKESLPVMETLSVEFQPEIGFTSDRINAHVGKDPIDMIVVGQELTDSPNDIKGFNLQHLISNSKLPVVIVPTEVNAEASIR